MDERGSEQQEGAVSMDGVLIDQAAQKIKDARRLIAFTGAGKETALTNLIQGQAVTGHRLPEGLLKNLRQFTTRCGGKKSFYLLFRHRVILTEVPEQHRIAHDHRRG